MEVLHKLGGLVQRLAALAEGAPPEHKFFSGGVGDLRPPREKKLMFGEVTSENLML